MGFSNKQEQPTMFKPGKLLGFKTQHEGMMLIKAIKTKAVFIIADERVDFRELIKILAEEFMIQLRCGK